MSRSGALSAGSSGGGASSFLRGTGLDGNGDPIVDIVSPYGIDAQGDPYYDPAGAVPGEEALLILDPNGAIALVRVGDAVQIDGYQPVDSDLTAIAALSTTSFGRGLLAMADAAAVRSALTLGTAATHDHGDYDAAGAAAAAQAASQPLDSDLTAIAALSTTSFGRGLLGLADAAAGRTTLGTPPLPTLGTHAARLAATATNGLLWKETNTGLIYVGNGTTWDIFKGDGTVYKTADETVNNSAVLQDDDHLFFPIEANEKWFVEAVLLVNAASANADFQLGWTGPTGATATWGRGPGTGGTSAWSFTNTTTAGAAASSIGAALSFGSAVGNGALLAMGWFTADATHAGTIKLQWAQNTATAEDNKVLAGSFLRLRRLA